VGFPRCIHSVSSCNLGPLQLGSQSASMTIISTGKLRLRAGDLMVSAGDGGDITMWAPAEESKGIHTWKVSQLFRCSPRKAYAGDTQQLRHVHC
jgi:hypothetical protein